MSSLIVPRRWMRGVILPFVLVLGACLPSQSPWRTASRLVLDRIQMDDAARRYPEEFSRAHRHLAEGDRLLDAGLSRESEEEYRSAWSIASGIEAKLARDHSRSHDDFQSRMESIHLDLSHSRAMLEQSPSSVTPPPSHPAASSPSSSPPTASASRRSEKPLVHTHTVRRGETLPQIAARPEIYGDSRLWPLIYRSNRDQIGDPRRLWPGQVLKIPRSYGAEVAAEARRFAAKNPL